MPTTPTLNAEAAAGSNRDGFGFVFATTCPVQENRTDVPYHTRPVAFKPHD